MLSRNGAIPPWLNANRSFLHSANYSTRAKVSLLKSLLANMARCSLMRSVKSRADKKLSSLQSEFLIFLRATTPKMFQPVSMSTQHVNHSVSSESSAHLIFQSWFPCGSFRLLSQREIQSYSSHQRKTHPLLCGLHSFGKMLGYLMASLMFCMATKSRSTV